MAAFDPWGAHVNTDYLNMTLPTNTLSPMDPFPPIAHRYVPFFPLSSVAQYQVNNWYPGTDSQPDSLGNFDKLLPEIPGNRALFAIVDKVTPPLTSCRWHLCENAAGRLRSPTNAAMTAALSNMKTARKNRITAADQVQEQQQVHRAPHERA